ncbi:tripartite tricarboxylate transporter TctB family protein [Pandoraea sp.]|uniref:tripartite tricarboxylate transporter TctB family protein n=1 Tax=Pandoraea sp. TaxID=1883445 RepID=UPI0035AF2900
MDTTSRFKKDHFGGTLMTLVGLVALTSGLQYHTGTLSRMGPGFFPVAIGALLAFVGILIAGTANGTAAEVPGEGHGHGLPDLRGIACIILGALSFLLLGTYGGLIPATFSIVFISALGDRTNTVKQAALLAMAMCIVAAVVFSWALQLQLPLFAWGT